MEWEYGRDIHRGLFERVAILVYDQERRTWKRGKELVADVESTARPYPRRTWHCLSDYMRLKNDPGPGLRGSVHPLEPLYLPHLPRRNVLYLPPNRTYCCLIRIRTQAMSRKAPHRGDPRLWSQSSPSRSTPWHPKMAHLISLN